jgi:hypothetical protein
LFGIVSYPFPIYVDLLKLKGWASIGMGYPLFNAFLPQYLQNAGKDQPPTPTYIVYRNYAITSVVGVPGSILACYTVDIKYIGRIGTMAISTLLTGIFLFIFTVSSEPNFALTFSSLEAFFQNIMYGVLYAYTPEGTDLRLAVITRLY